VAEAISIKCGKSYRLDDDEDLWLLLLGDHRQHRPRRSSLPPFSTSANSQRPPTSSSRVQGFRDAT